MFEKEMRISSLSIWMIFSLAACHPDKNTPVDLDKLSFKSTDASEIFFRNMRRSYYNKEENKEAAIELYTLTGYEKIGAASLKPTIAYNWRNDFVAVMLNKSEELSNQETLVLLFETSDGQEKLILNETDVKTQTTVAIKLYNSILNKHEIFLVRERQKEPLFKNNEEKDFFRITIFDFLRFVEMR